MVNQVPNFLQSAVWSVNTKNLDLQKDKAYIINQVLAYGDVKDLKWLFKTYPSQTIKNVFLKKPIKTYRPQAYNFAKNILLEIDKPLNQNHYVINTPRVIR